jgi:hypothetical protein
MTVTRDQTATGQASASVSTLTITWPTLPAAGSKALIGLTMGGGQTASVTSAVDNGTTPRTFTADIGVAEGASNAGKYILRADNITLPSSGNYHVTITLSATVSWVTGCGRTYLGVASGGPTSAPAAATGTSSSPATPNVTPAVTGALLFGVFDDTSAVNPESITLTTSGATTVYAQVNGASFLAGAVADKIATTTSSQGLAWTLGDSPDWGAWIAVYSPGATAHPAAAALTGTGTLTAGAGVGVPRGVTLTGTGALTTAPVIAIPEAAALAGDGTLTAGADALAPGQVSAALTGTGTLAIAGGLGWSASASLAGLGTLTAGYTGLMLQSAALSGDGLLTVAGTAALKFTAGLFGAGFLSIPQVAGGLVSGVGGAGSPMALPGSSQVAVAPPGSSNWQWLGTLGHVTALTYSYVCPGGADKLTMTILVPPAYRTQLFNPGWQVKVTRGGHQVWAGKLDEPQPSPQGWTLTAVGNGNRGTDYLAVYSGTWPAGQPDNAVNAAITRGLPWGNPGIGSPAGIWLGQSVDSGAQTITGLLNLVTSRGGLTWYVNSQPGGLYGSDDLSVFPLPTTPNRLLVVTTPVARTLGGDVNTIYIRYQSGSESATTGTTATYSTVTAVNAQSVAAHGTLEQFIDISDAGLLTSAAAQAVGTNALLLFQRASFAGPFQASYGQLLNIGGAPIDPGTDQSATMVRVLLYDYGLGGEVVPGPITWITGAYEWDDFKMVATLTPMQVLDQSLSSLLSAGHASIMPVAVAASLGLDKDR